MSHQHQKCSPLQTVNRNTEEIKSIVKNSVEIHTSADDKFATRHLGRVTSAEDINRTMQQYNLQN